MAKPVRTFRATPCSFEERRAADVRKAELRREREIRKIDRRRSAVSIQAAWRGFCVRQADRVAKDTKAYLSLLFVVIRIQRTFREYLNRKQLRMVRDREHRLKFWAGWVIQSAARCAPPKRELARRRAVLFKSQESLRRTEKATVIQKYCRGYLQRKLSLWLRESDTRRHLAVAAPVSKRNIDRTTLELPDVLRHQFLEAAATARRQSQRGW